MFKCPHCGKQGISIWSKLTIGINNPTICRQCGNEVGVPRISLLFIIPFIIVPILVLSYAHPIILKVAIIVIMNILIGFLYLKYVPLIPRYK